MKYSMIEVSFYLLRIDHLLVYKAAAMKAFKV